MFTKQVETREWVSQDGHRLVARFEIDWEQLARLAYYASHNQTGIAVRGPVAVHVEAVGATEPCAVQHRVSRRGKRAAR